MSGSGGGNTPAPGGNGGPRLDALLRQVATNGPPNKKAKVGPIQFTILLTRACFISNFLSGFKSDVEEY